MTEIAAYPPVVVLLGGPSAEHDVSIVSGTAIAEALVRAGLRVTQVLIDLDGGWWWLPEGHRRDGRPGAAYDQPRALEADGPYTLGRAIDRIAGVTPERATTAGSTALSPVAARASGAPYGGEAPVVFIALHGPFGEDGTIQAILDATGLAYTGAGVLASAIGMDKTMQKRIWRGMGLPVVDWREVTVARWRREPEAVLGELEAFAAAAGDPRLMVKPARLGSSVGMTLAHAPGERSAALEEAFRFDPLAIVEVYLPGARDLEVAVIGTEPPLGIHGPGEIVPGHEFYDFAAKYTPGLSETSTHAELPERMRETMRKLARDAYRGIACEGFARVDFLVQGEAMYVSEINTIPGFTPISLFPTMPSEAGLDFTAVCLRVLDLALERHRSRSTQRLTPADLPR